MLLSQLYYSISGNAHFIYTSRIAQSWFNEIDVQKIDYPFLRTDLNLIEHLWDELESTLGHQPNRPSSICDGLPKIISSWHISKLCGNFPDPCKLSLMQMEYQHHALRLGESITMGLGILLAILFI